MDNIRSKRLSLRPAQPSDFAAMLDIYGRPEVARNVASWPFPPDHDLVRERCMPFPRKDGIVGVVERADQIVGTMGIAREGDGSFGMGYGFHPDHWGLGYATEIGHALIGVIFARYDVDRVTAGNFLDNPASGRVLEKLGFRKTQIEPHHSKGRGCHSDCQKWQLTRQSWSAANPIRLETERLVLRPSDVSDVINRFRTESVNAYHVVDNPQSGRVLAKRGFKSIGVALGKSVARLEATPEVLYRLTRSAFKAARP